MEIGLFPWLIKISSLFLKLNPLQPFSNKKILHHWVMDCQQKDRRFLKKDIRKSNSSRKGS
jgi:hypothetical protein